MPNDRTRSRGGLAATAVQIVQRALERDVAVSDLVKLAELDPAFAGRLLAGANSAAFGGQGNIRTIKAAGARLGVRGLRNIALGLIVADATPGDSRGQLLIANSIRRASAARAVGAALRVQDADACFTAALLLEFGLLQKTSEDLDAVASIARAPALQRPTLERVLGWPTHPESGAAFARELKLPAEMVDAIDHHHDAEVPEGEIARVVWLAERFAAVFEGGPISVLQAGAVAAAEQVGLAPDDALALLDALPLQVEEGARALQRDIEAQVDLRTLLEDANRSLVELNMQYESTVQTLERVVREKERLAEELEHANECLRGLAHTDELTKLPNKRAFTDALKRDLGQADRNEAHVSLVVVDVDHFKKFNDTWGHAVGDQVLAAVGEVIAANLRVGDFAARYGGEEFVVLLPATGMAGAITFAERLRCALEATRIDGPKGLLGVTASLGIASAFGPQCRDSGRELFQRADDALYEAKAAGRNCVRAKV